MRRAAVTALAVLASGSASADISRTEVVDRARAYTFYPWTSSAANQSASCASGYDSAFVAGDYVGVAYDWGGWASLFEFDQKIADGYGAGSPAFGEVYWCTVGVDCSGFVSQAWQTQQKYATATLHQVSHEIAAGELLPGDVFNKPSYHVAMYMSMLDSGEPLMYEAVGYNTHINPTGGWSYVSGFDTRRYDSITGTSVATPVGTLSHPIEVTSFPFTDTRDTRDSLSDVLDGCGAQPGTSESGPELVYAVEITEPGTLTVAVSDDAGADIDVHLYESWNTATCTTRHDSSFSTAVDCGTYYVVADTYGSEQNAGAFDLTVHFSATQGQACGSGPSGFDPAGGLGDPCAYPDDPELPFCNPTLGGDVCLYTSGQGATSFCTTACETDAECGGLPGGGCCSEIAAGESYCVTSALCESGGGDEQPGAPEGTEDGEDDKDGDEPSPAPAPAPESGGTGGCSATGSASGGRALLWLLLAMVAMSGRGRTSQDR